MLRDLLQYSPPIKFASERKTLKDAYATRPNTKMTVRSFSFLVNTDSSFFFFLSAEKRPCASCQ